MHYRTAKWGLFGVLLLVFFVSTKYEGLISAQCLIGTLVAYLTAWGYAELRDAGLTLRHLVILTLCFATIELFLQSPWTMVVMVTCLRPSDVTLVRPFFVKLRARYPR